MDTGGRYASDGCRPTVVATPPVEIRAPRATPEPAATCAAAAAATVQLKPGAGVTVEAEEDEATQTSRESPSTLSTMERTFDDGAA